jgi:hypothetical protein
MRVTRNLLLLCSICSALIVLALSAADRVVAGGDRVAFQAILVVASDEGVTDASLAAFEPKLRGLFRFKSYRRIGGGSALIAAAGESTVLLGLGHSLDLWVDNVTETEVSFGARWFNEKVNLVNMKGTRRRGGETILGGPKTEDGHGHYAVIITAK